MHAIASKASLALERTLAYNSGFCETRQDDASSWYEHDTLLDKSLSILFLRNLQLTWNLIDIKNGTGNADMLFVNDETPKPTPRNTDALVKIKAFGLNRMDLLQREGHYPVPPQAPKTLGVEFSGVIEGFGKDAEKGFKTGDEVFGLAYGGESMQGRLF